MHGQYLLSLTAVCHICENAAIMTQYFNLSVFVMKCNLKVSLPKLLEEPQLF